MSAGVTAAIRLSVIRDAAGRISRIRYVLPRQKTANWGGPGPTLMPSPVRMTPPGLRGPNSWPGWGRSFRSSARTVAVSPARGPPADWSELVQVCDDRDIFQASPDELPAIDIRSF